MRSLFYRGVLAGMVTGFLGSGLCQAQPADLVLQGGQIYQVDEGRHWAQALAIQNGRVVAVGDNQAVSAWIGPATRRIELGGQMVLPGFCDAHVHPLWGGLEASRCGLSLCHSLQELSQAIALYADHHRDLSWVEGSGWALPLFEGGNPGRQLLDRLVPGRPAAFESADGHSLWLNTRALQQCGITRHTADPAGGRIEREADGAPSGCLRESAMELARPFRPKISAQQRQQALAWALQELARFGVTSFQEACALPEDLQAYSALERQGCLTARVVVAQALDDLPALLRRRQQFQGSRLRVDAVKIFLDGVMEAHTAALLQPYADRSGRGQLMHDPQSLRELVPALVRSGFQLHFHAIGDQAARTALDLLELAGETERLRPTVAHLQLVDEADLPRFARLGVVVNIQGYWAMADEYVTRLTNPVLGEQRAARQYPLASFFESGARVAAGSDWPVSTGNPLEAMEVALTRRAPESQDPPWIPEQRVTLEQMIGAYTMGGAYLNHLEQETGSLEVGKWADLVVLDRNLFEIPTQEIHAVRVTMTMLGGQIVYERGSNSRNSEPGLRFSCSRRPPCNSASIREM